MEKMMMIQQYTFVCAPELLQPTLQFKTRPDLLLAGQLSGVEGYIESAAMGLLAGINSARLIQGDAPVIPPPETALGALICHLTESEPKKFQPLNLSMRREEKEVIMSLIQPIPTLCIQQVSTEPFQELI